MYRQVGRMPMVGVSKFICSILGVKVTSPSHHTIHTTHRYITVGRAHIVVGDVQIVESGGDVMMGR